MYVYSYPVPHGMKASKEMRVNRDANLWRCKISGNGLRHYMKSYMRYILSNFATIILMLR